MYCSCEKDERLKNDPYTCTTPLYDSTSAHPNAVRYQQILDENQKKGLVGTVLLVKDKYGTWAGASGKADIASDIDMKPCNTFLIASISKVFTATAVYRCIDKGILSMNDPISKWLDKEVVDKVDNADEAQIKHLLSHTSGIRDYYTSNFELHRMNKEYNEFTKKDVLTYIYGKKAYCKVGEQYIYCNTNFLLLSIILENATGLAFNRIYEQEVFEPCNLPSAYYSESNPIPSNCVKGYYDLFASQKIVESENLYKDELGIGGDGGIAINAFDLASFFEQLGKGLVLSKESFTEMTNWFEIPKDWQWEEYGQTENGYGIEKFNTAYGYAIGHTGGIDGFSSYAFFFPETDHTYVLLVNSVVANADKAEHSIFEQVLEVLKEE